MRLLRLLLLISITSTSFCQAAEESPYAKGFSSSLTTDLGWQPNLSLIHSKVNTTSTYRIDEKDSQHLRWRLGSRGTPDSIIVFQDGKIQVGSRSKFDPSTKDRLDKELNDAIQLINGTNKLPLALRLKALSLIQYYSQDSPVDAESWRLCGDQLYKRGEYSSSLQYYDRSSEKDGQKAESWNNKGAALANLGRYPEAIDCYDMAINVSQASSIPWNNKALALSVLGKSNQSLECLNRSCRLEEGNAQAWFNKAVLLSEMGRYIEALECYNKSIQADFNSPQTWNNKGLALMKLGQLNASLDCFINAANLKKLYAEPWVNAGLALQTMGAKVKSDVCFNEAALLGYKGAREYQWAGMASPEMMDGASKSIPQAGGELAAMGLLLAWRLGPRSTRRKNGSKKFLAI